ncbi:uncharacterized protein BKA78DRAFT_321315 [Phyllosticta capitalensis]|uniref:uncharacterized protein n=1 Tax=Phyllosticta capitalensis TaxID=121624 RepID=UPI00312E71E1
MLRFGRQSSSRRRQWPPTGAPGKPSGEPRDGLPSTPWEFPTHMAGGCNPRVARRSRLGKAVGIHQGKPWWRITKIAAPAASCEWQHFTVKVRQVGWWFRKDSNAITTSESLRLCSVCWRAARIAFELWCCLSGVEGQVKAPWGCGRLGFGDTCSHFPGWRELVPLSRLHRSRTRRRFIRADCSDSGCRRWIKHLVECF